MWRETAWLKAACAAAGFALVFAAAFGLNSAHSGNLLDLSFLYPQHSPSKSDRLPVSTIRPSSAFAISFHLPAHGVTMVAKNPPLPSAVSAIRFRRDPAPVLSVKPQENTDQEKPDVAQKPKLPEGCEPPFSPVTVPAMAHIASRCTS